jgi:transcriptional regulator with XRE-family HTH domain
MAFADTCVKSVFMNALSITQLSVPYISRIENGAKRASLSSLIKIAAALEVTMDSLLLDVIPYDGVDFRELSALLNDCGNTERKMIMDTILGTAESLKQGLRELLGGTVERK